VFVTEIMELKGGEFEAEDIDMDQITFERERINFSKT